MVVTGSAGHMEAMAAAGVMIGGAHCGDGATGNRVVLGSAGHRVVSWNGMVWVTAGHRVKWGIAWWCYDRLGTGWPQDRRGT